jgi:hypothetical protein
MRALMAAAEEAVEKRVADDAMVSRAVALRR